jgi:cytochrome b
VPQQGEKTLEAKTITVWDPFVRASHWVLAVSFLVAFFTAEEFDTVHEVAGYTALVTASLRILWAFVGPRHARFADFVYRPAMVVAYLRDLVMFRARRHLGHSPAGGAMVVALLAITVAIGWSGVELEEGGVLFAAAPQLIASARADGDGDGGGEKAIEEIHETLGNLGILLVVLHLAGVALASVVHRENLARAMVTGRKRAD